MNLYDDLGVAPDAGLEVIRAAYRNAAKRAHPDTGGDRAAFERIQRAYDILADDVRRARYDATGEVDDGPAAREAQEASTLLQQLVQRVVFGDLDLIRNDLVGAVLSAAKTAREQAAGKTAQIEARLARIETVRERLSWIGPDGPDLIADLLTREATELRAALPGVARALRVHDRVIGLLNGYMYRVDLEGGSASFLYGEQGLTLKIARTPKVPPPVES